jgi:formiminoglutamate deiminase
MYALAGVLDPDTYHLLAKATYAEMRLAGYTSVGEFHYLHHAPDGRPYADPNAMAEAVVEAALAVGLRICLLHTRYARAGFPTGTAEDVPPASPSPPAVGVEARLDPIQRRFADHDLDAWQQRVLELDRLYAGDDRVVVGTAIHSVRAVPAHEFAMIAATLPDAPLHVHLSEQRAENAACLAATGRTPTRLLADASLWSDRTTAVHATHLTDDDIAILGEARATVCFCPTTEAELADGIGPSVALREAGARVTLGSDSNTVIDGFAEARGLAMHERLASGRRDGWTSSHLWRAATIDGHVSLGFRQRESIALRESVQTAGVEDPIWAADAATVVPPAWLDPERVAADLSDVIVGLWRRL